MPLTENKPIKKLNEYKIAMKDLLIKKNKSFDYISGYISCLNDNKHLSIQDALDLSGQAIKRNHYEKDNHLN